MRIENEVKDIILISEGGQKIVYKGYHNEYGQVVIKYVKKSSCKRTKREINFLSSISDGNYPRVYDYEITKDKKYIIVEEFIDGVELEKIKNNYKGDEKKIILLLNDLINGLKIIWDKNIIHRDLKPRNIMIKDDKPVILDLGIARFNDKDSLTDTIFKYGPYTPGYASPEQITNKKNMINERSDFFSLGVIIYELYLGFNPFTFDNPEDAFNNILNNKFYDLNKIEASNNFKLLIKKTMNNKQHMRFRNYSKFKNFLKNNWGDIL